ncbi:Putative NAD(P)-dependent oxidoreductase EC-YbbO [Pseudoalteromonas luteoviolacea B = ATCC 29581]|nr:Putative NAD(P)-dependent oxidoreductase EC-YbbO [Pseudoalteromonas luteoviolacea B = ATCC 29581]
MVATVRKEADQETLLELGIQSVILDYADKQSIAFAFSSAIELLDGKIDLLFNNGAYGQPGAVEDLSVDALRLQFETNFFGWHDLTIRVLNVMLSAGSGKIVHNSSVLGLVSLPYRGAYNASKFALEGLTDTLRMELHNTNIHVSLIEPGPIVSKFRENARQAFFKHIPNWQESRHVNEYEKQINRLSAADAPQRFTLGPEAVFDKLEKIIKSDKPNARYYVTFPTYLMGTLKRLLSSALLDKILLKNK